MIYIGETGKRLGDRFREHIRSVSVNTDLPIGEHFASLGHSMNNMLVSVICVVFRTTTVRCSIETRLIFRQQTLQPSGMHFSNYYFLAGGLLTLHISNNIWYSGLKFSVKGKCAISFQYSEMIFL